MGNKEEVVQLKVLLKGSKPSIWRRLLVKSNSSLYELHFTIQLAMGWGNYHLFEFNVSDYTVGTPDEEFNLEDSDVIDAEEIKLGEIVLQGVKEFEYIYDFGDYWEHTIVVEKVLEREDRTYLPVCLDGQMNCPPEDCGGIPGYEDLLKVVKDEKHPEHESMKEWLGEEYDPEEFDVEEVNSILEELEDYMEDFENDDDNFWL